MLKLLIATTAIALCTACPTFAQSPTQIGQFKAWGAYSYQSKDRTICYALTVPVSQQPTNVDHGDNFFMITQIPGDDASLEPQLKAGYNLNETKRVVVTIAGRKFYMMSAGSRAWVENEADEPQLLALLRSQQKMSVDFVSARGTNTHYRYSLLGVSAALKAVSMCK